MRLGILTGGGDVAPLNTVITSVIQKCNAEKIELIGYKKGWEGILEEQWIPLNNTKIPKDIGGTILKASRINIKKIVNGPELVIDHLKRDKLDGLIIIGGEDTLSNALHIKDFPKVLISKTIDNDVGQYRKGNFVNYFTLGYPTAAEKIASFVSLNEGMRTTAYSHERIMIIESMGMHAGWLALASSQGHPDFILIPEFPFDFDLLKEKVARRYKEQKHVMIVISEGAKWMDGTHISADYSETDSFGHPRFRGTAEVVSKRLKEDLKGEFDTRNVNSVNPSYLYRSGAPNTLDQEIAVKMGRYAVEHLKNSKNTIFLCAEKEEESTFDVQQFQFNNLNNIEEFHRFVDDSLYDPMKMNITKEGKEYFQKFTRSFPEINYTI